MNCTVVIDWKFAAAVGVTAVAGIFAWRLPTTDVKEVSIHAINTCKNLQFN